MGDDAIREAMAVVKVLPSVLDASVTHDGYGVVLSTIPYVLSLLVRLHAGLEALVKIKGGVADIDGLGTTAGWLAPGGDGAGGSPGGLGTGMDAVRNEGDGMVRRVSERMLRAVVEEMGMRGQMRMVVGLKDVVTVCVYRVTYAFREVVKRLVDGREAGWDAEATAGLRPFVAFDA